MKFTRREVLGIFLVLVVGFFSLASWQVFFGVVMTPGVSDIWQPVLWFSALAVFFFLGTILWTSLPFRIAGAVSTFLPGLFFMRSWEYIVAGIVSIIFIFWSSMSIAREARERIYFRFFKSAHVGQFLFVVGLSLSISGGYYVFLKDVSWEELVPRFRIGQEVAGIVFKVAGAVNPSFAKLSEGDTTVDEFLLSLEESSSKEDSSFQDSSEKKMSVPDIASAFFQMDRLPKGMSGALFSDVDRAKIAEQLFLESGREQIATLVGRKVLGSEKISDVLSLTLQNKLITFLSEGKETQHIPSQAVPFFLSLLLFLTLLSFTSIFIPLCILGAELIFMLLLRVGWLKIGTFVVEQKKLVE